MWLTAWNYVVGWVRQESAATTAMVQAFIALGIAFSWWHWSPAQTGAVIGIVAALLGMFVRSQVTPLHTLKARTGPGGGPAARPAAGRTAPASAPGRPAAEAATRPGAGPAAEPAPGPAAEPGAAVEPGAGAEPPRGPAVEPPPWPAPGEPGGRL
jgi:hypothetical protein